MQVAPIRTDVISAGITTLESILDAAITDLSEGSIVAITSKIVSLCEGSVVPKSDAEKDDLISQESTKYLGREHSKYGLAFTITNNTLIPTAGIDESNGNDNFVLWPRNPQAVANQVRSYLAERFNLTDVGVFITDSTCQPMRRGTSGIAIAHSGFHATKNYIGQKDLFGHEYRVTHANISGMLAAAAVVTMGEGTEQTPLALITDVPFVEFDAAAPDADELELLRILPEEDLFAPFLQSVDWLSGEGKATPRS